MSGATPWRTEPRDLARAILADRRYLGHPVTTAKPSVWDTIWTWLRERLHDIVHAIAHAPGASGSKGTFVGAVLIALGGIAFLYLLVQLIAWIVLRTGLARRRSTGFEPDTRRTAAELRAEARAAAARGAYRDAARLVFFAALRALDETGRFAYDAALTPGEYRRAVRDPRFDVLAREATVALFATAEPDAALVERMERAYDGYFASA